MKALIIGSGAVGCAIAIATVKAVDGKISDRKK